MVIVLTDMKYVYKYNKCKILNTLNMCINNTISSGFITIQKGHA